MTSHVRGAEICVTEAPVPEALTKTSSCKEYVYTYAGENVYVPCCMKKSLLYRG